MRLPTVPNDFRPSYSSTFCIANLQYTKPLGKGMELYGGIKNLLNFVPNNPILRPEDPFNKSAGDLASNPQGYTFDPSYIYASMQGIRGFLGFRYNWN
jgi:outer membrane receptor for ferrienterochelin and colicins